MSSGRSRNTSEGTHARLFLPAVPRRGQANRDDATTGLIGANVTTAHWGFAVEYTFYLTNRFTPSQLPQEEPLHQFIPLIEFSFDSPTGQKTAAAMNPGISYVEDVWQVSAEVIVPLNSQGAHGLGVRTQLLLFLDDRAPSPEAAMTGHCGSP